MTVTPIPACSRWSTNRPTRGSRKSRTTCAWSPRGALVVCEDGDGEGWTDDDDSCRQEAQFRPHHHAWWKIFDFAKVVEPLDLVDVLPR